MEAFIITVVYFLIGVLSNQFLIKTGNKKTVATVKTHYVLFCATWLPIWIFGILWMIIKKYSNKEKV